MVIVFMLRRFTLQTMRLASNWYLVPMLLAAVGVLTWIALFWVERDLVRNLLDYLYWFVITVSSTGYGDITPKTGGGRVVAIVVVSVGVIMYGLIAGQAASLLVTATLRRQKGQIKVDHLEKQIVIIGWNSPYGFDLVAELTADHPRLDVVIAAEPADLSDRPKFNGNIHFKEIIYRSRQLVTDLNIAAAQAVIIYTDNDELVVMLARRLAVACPETRIIITLRDMDLAGDVADIRTVTPVMRESVHLIANEVRCPGTARLLVELLSSQEGDDNQQFVVPKNWDGVTIGQLQLFLKSRSNALIVGYELDGVNYYNPSFDLALRPGAVVTYWDKNELPEDIFRLSPHAVSIH